MKFKSSHTKAVGTYLVRLAYQSYYNLDLMSICLLLISSVVYRLIGTKLGRNIRDGHGIRLRALVSMETNLPPWQPQKGYF